MTSCHARQALFEVLNKMQLITPPLESMNPNLPHTFSRHEEMSDFLLVDVGVEPLKFVQMAL